jgi:MFS family permease
VVAALRILPRFEREVGGAPDPLDFRGLILLSVGLPLFTYGLAEVGVTGSFTATKVVFPLLAGIALIGVFVWHALRTRHPLLDLRLWRRPSFSSASFAMFCLSAAMFGGMVLLPLYWQAIRHESPLQTGLLTAPQGLGAALMMPLAGKWTDRWGGGPLALFGVIVTAVTTIPFGLIGAHSSILWLSIAMFARGIGIGFAFMPAFSAAFATLDRTELSDATPQLNTLQRVGGSLGIALLAVVLQRALVGAHTLAAQASAYGTAFWASTILTVLAIGPCVILWRTERAARAALRAPPDEAGQALAEAVPV